jgi:hypothetical protein
MYTVDGRDSVVELAGVPQSCTGAPLPVVLANEHDLLLAFLLCEPHPNWDGKTIEMVSPKSDNKALAIVRFRSPRAHYFGPPNDEAFGGHPLASRGLRPYGAFEVQDSSWIRHLERMNSIHPGHRPELFAGLRHLVFSFHDSTFECIAEGFEVAVQRGSMDRATQAMSLMLRNGPLST